MEWFKHSFTVHAPSNMGVRRLRKIYSIVDESKMSKLQHCKFIQNRKSKVNPNNRWTIRYHKCKMSYYGKYYTLKGGFGKL